MFSTVESNNNIGTRVCKTSCVGIRTPSLSILACEFEHTRPAPKPVSFYKQPVSADVSIHLCIHNVCTLI